MKIKKIAVILISILVLSGLFLLILTNTHPVSKSTNKAASAKISAVMTGDQFVNQIAKDTKSSSDAVGQKIKEAFGGSGSAFAHGTSYRILTMTAPLWPNYQPTVCFYCQTTENKDHHEISKIIGTYLKREYGGNSKQFSGTLFSNLEDPHTIYFELNGDFCNSGTTLPNFAWGSLKEDHLTLNCKITNSSNYFGTADYSDKIVW